MSAVHGYVLAAPNEHDHLQIDWDGDVHPTIESATREMREANGECDAGCDQCYRVYALVRA